MPAVVTTAGLHAGAKPKHAHTYTYTYTHTHTHAHTHTRTYMQAHTYMHVHTHMHTHAHTYIHEHTYMHTYTCIYTHACTHTHTHTHTHTDPLCPSFLHLTGQEPPRDLPRRVAQTELQVKQPFPDPSRVSSVGVSVCEAGLWLGGLEFPLILGPNCVINLAARHCLQTSEATRHVRIR